MSASKVQAVPVFADGFDLCREVGKAGEVNLAACAASVSVPEGFAPGPGCFAVFVNDGDERLNWAEEWQDGIGFFEPVAAPVQAGEAYLFGRYDARHSWLDGASVDRIAAIVEGQAIFKEGETLDCMPLDQLLFVARLAGVRARA